MRAVKIPADSAQVAVVVDDKLTLEYLQEAVGGFIEAVNVDQVLTDSGRKQVDCTVFVNEEGLIVDLPPNYRATDLCFMTLGGSLRASGIVRGDVIVVGPPGPEGEETPCPENVVEIIREWGWLR